MEFCVRDMMKLDILKDAVLVGKGTGLERTVSGVTIIESPDIVKFISGGEVLLSGLYAFHTYSLEEFREYVGVLSKKEISALIIKRGREMDTLDEKIGILVNFADENQIPLLEIPIETSFREIMTEIMEHIFNQEVIRLKYFKTTHENFAALSLSMNSNEDGVERILDVLSKLIDNPVALFGQNMECLASTSPKINELSVSERAKKYEPDFYSNYTYLKQNVFLSEEHEQPCNQYIVRLNLMYNVKLYLVVTECNSPIDSMAHIAIENGVTALKHELFRQYSIAELEKKFQSDIWNNILNGKVNTLQELRRSTKILGINIEADYRVLVFCLNGNDDRKAEDINERMKYFKVLNDAIMANVPNVKIQNDLDKVFVIQEANSNQKQEAYRRELKETIAAIQKKVSSKYKHLKVWTGVGKVVHGLLHVQESFKEANDSLLFIDILGENVGEENARLMIFSDMGIFKLLCQLKTKEQLLEYVPESLQKLYNYKKPQREDLLTTLKTYLDRNQNLARTAQDLFIHYKTAAYRIERISDITGIDFDNSNEMLAVRIGLIVYKMIENLDK